MTKFPLCQTLLFNDEKNEFHVDPGRDSDSLNLQERTNEPIPVLSLMKQLIGNWK